jgi:hypothetical protein
MTLAATVILSALIGGLSGALVFVWATEMRNKK